MVNKMRVVMVKLLKINIIAPLTYIYFNTYLLKSVYFGCRIVQLDNEQEYILQNIYEIPFLWNLQLSEKIPKEVLCIRQSALEIRLIKLSMAVDVLALKLYLGNKRVKNRIVRLLLTNKEL